MLVSIDIYVMICQESVYMSSRMRLAKASIMVAAFLSFILSIYLWFSGSKEQAIFVGLWVPSILSFGALVYSGAGRNE